MPRAHLAARPAAAALLTLVAAALGPAAPAAAQVRPDSAAVAPASSDSTAAWSPADSAAVPFAWPEAPPDDAAAADSTAWPVGADAAVDAYAAADTLGGPITLDSLRMSPWERVWWGRSGVFRRIGLFPTHPDDPTADVRQIAAVRRRMLSTHQLLGLATVASMAVTVVGGQLAVSTGRAGLHEASLPVTIGLYSTAATLALLAPPRLYAGGSRRVDSIQVHKWLAIGHMAGMLLTPLLAPDDGDGRAVHQTLGYATFATFTAAMITVTFFR